MDIPYPTNSDMRHREKENHRASRLGGSPRRTRGGSGISRFFYRDVGTDDPVTP